MSNIEYENGIVIDLVTAMLGSISNNFRRVSVKVVEDGIRLEFVLQEESEEDREEISDIEFEFEALQETSIKVDIDVLVTTEDLGTLHRFGRAIFVRRER